MDCGRPVERSPQIPPSLYSSILAEAIDAMEKEPSKDAMKLFTDLDSAMRAIYESDKMRNETFYSKLSRCLAKYSMQFDTGSIKNYPMNGLVKSLLIAIAAADTYFPMCILGGNNEVGQGGAEPFFQDLMYYQAAVDAIISKGLNTNFPVLLIVLAGLSSPLPILLFFWYIGYATGNSLKLFACVFTKRPTSELIGEYTFGYDQSNEQQQERGLRVVHAMFSTIRKLKNYYHSFQTSAITQPCFPYPRECADIDNRKPPLAFTYIEQLPLRTSRLFKVKIYSTGHTAILKFTKRYGKDAHIFAAKREFAP